MIQILKTPSVKKTGSVESTWSSAAHPIEFVLQCSPADELLRPNYRIVIESYEAGTNTLLSSQRLQPFSNGLLTVDLSTHLRQYLKTDSDLKYLTGAANQADVGMSVQFYIKYWEEWDNPDPLALNPGEPIVQPSTIDSGRYFATVAAKQVGSGEYGQNMADYVGVKETVSEDKKAKFLTPFKEPVAFKGWPFSLSMIYDLNLAGYEVAKVEIRRDFGKGPLDNSQKLLARNTGFINRIYLDGNYPENVKYVDVTINTGQKVQGGHIEKGYVTEGYVQEGDPEVNQ